MGDSFESRPALSTLSAGLGTVGGMGAHNRTANELRDLTGRATDVAAGSIVGAGGVALADLSRAILPGFFGWLVAAFFFFAGIGGFGIGVFKTLKQEGVIQGQPLSSAGRTPALPH